ncbi:hypothetical protein ACI65C_009790 [Semiaphis heraclei]
MELGKNRCNSCCVNLLVIIFAIWIYLCIRSTLYHVNMDNYMHGARSIGEVRPDPAQCGQSRATATLLAGNATRGSATHMAQFCGHRVFLSFPLFSFHDPTASYGRESAVA